MKNIFESFFWGIIAALGALVVELFVFIGVSAHNNSFSSSFSDFFILPQFIIIAACIEEILKYLIISRRIELISLEKTYIINSLFVGLGFFGVEFAFLSTSGFPLPATQFLAEVTILHIGTAGLIGYFVAIGNPKKISTFFWAFLSAGIFHVAYNLLNLERNYIENYAIFAILGVLMAINAINIIKISRKSF